MAHFTILNQLMGNNLCTAEASQTKLDVHHCAVVICIYQISRYSIPRLLSYDSGQMDGQIDRQMDMEKNNIPLPPTWYTNYIMYQCLI